MKFYKTDLNLRHFMYCGTQICVHFALSKKAITVKDNEVIVFLLSRALIFPQFAVKPARRLALVVVKKYIYIIKEIIN